VREKNGQTERAAALKYEPGKPGAPKVVAAGQGYIAREIIRTAQSHGVPLHREPTLAAALQNVELGREIPPELYRAVAEVLAFVYLLEQKKAAGK
jgi:flagellar biosynthesis protein